MSDKKKPTNGPTILFLIIAIVIGVNVATHNFKPSGSFSDEKSTIGLNNSYSTFYDWVTTDRQDDMLKNIGNPYQIIASTCQNLDKTFSDTWIACMQKGYKDYLSPETFTEDNWQGDYSTMMGYVNDAIGEKNMYGSASETDKWKDDMTKAKAIYERIAIKK